jgi:hypothetical protein
VPVEEEEVFEEAETRYRDTEEEGPATQVGYLWVKVMVSKDE